MDISTAISNGKVHHAPAHFELRPVAVDDVRRYWSHVEGGIKKILRKMRGTYDLMPEEVFVFVMRKMAWLYLITLDGKTVGWIIMRKMLDDFSQKPVLVLWLGESNSTEAKKLAIAEAEDIGRKNNFAKIRIFGRWGWERRPPEGWKVSTVILEKDLG